MPIPNTATVVCENPGCPAHGQPRNVGLIHLGQDVYLDGPLRCGACGSQAEMRRTNGGE